MSPRPSYNQIVKLIEFLEENPGIATGSLRTAAAKAETKRKWMMFAPCINNAGDAMKDGLGWAKYWAEKKCALKKLCADRHAFREFITISELDKRMINAMGGLKAVIRDDSMCDSMGDNMGDDTADLLDFPPPSPSSTDSNRLVLDTNPSSPVSSSASLPSPPREIEEKYRERSPIRLPSPMRSPQTLPLKKQALRPTFIKEEVLVPAETPVPTSGSRLRDLLAKPFETPQPKTDSKANRPKPLIKKEGIFVSNKKFSELVTRVEKIATSHQTMSSALSLLAKAFLELSKKLPKPE